LTAELNSAIAKHTALETAMADFKAKETEIVALIGELRSLKNEWKPAARSNTSGGKNNVDGIDIERVREIINIKNK
jgi:hypothetical protein